MPFVKIGDTEHPPFATMRPLDFSDVITNVIERTFGAATKKTIAVKRVIYNDPATIILWADGTKTVVKVHDEPFDKEKGFAMAVLKKALGDDFHRVLREYCE